LLPITILSLAIQVALIIHAIKTGRNQLWILALAFAPGVGSIAYFIVEVLPEMTGSRTARRAKSGVQRMIDPNRDMRRAAAEVEISGNLDARRRLAAEQYERGQYTVAIETYSAGLKGIFEHDPTLLQGLAQAQFASKDYAAARATLERLTAHNPEFKSGETHLLYARSLEEVGALEEAEKQYSRTSGAFPGAESRLRYGLLLKKRGKALEAQRVFKDLLDSAQLGPAHFRKAQAKWLDIARREAS
jgi:hypothetical protein